MNTREWRDKHEEEFRERRRREAMLARKYEGWTGIEQNAPRMWTGKAKPGAQRERPPLYYENLSAAWTLLNAIAAVDGSLEVVQHFHFVNIVALPPAEAAARIADHAYWLMTEEWQTT